MKPKEFTLSDYIKASRKGSREAEIENHGHPICYKMVHKSKKVYDRKRNKAENKKALPYFFCVLSDKLFFCKKLGLISDIWKSTLFRVNLIDQNHNIPMSKDSTFIGQH